MRNGSTFPWYARIRRERELRNLSQQEVATALNTCARVVGAWEWGERFPSYYYRRELCRFYGKSAKELGLLTLRGVGKGAK